MKLTKAPVLGTIANQTVDEGSTLTFTATATDSDSAAQHTLTYSLSGTPAGATINAKQQVSLAGHQAGLKVLAAIPSTLLSQIMAQAT